MHKAFSKSIAPLAQRSSWKRIARGVLSSGIFYDRLRAHALRKDPVTILVYHTLGRDDEDFDAWTVLRMEQFREQVALLREHYDIVSLDNALEMRRSPGQRPLAVITFDDGEAGLHTHLLPFLAREKLPVTIYVATQQIESGQAYWFDEIMNALQSAGPFEIDLRPHGLPLWSFTAEFGAPRWMLISDVLETLKAASPADRAELSASVLAQAPRRAGRRFTALAPLTVAQLAELAASPWISIGAHSHCHSLLDQLSGPQVEASAEHSRALLEAWTGKPVRHFAYPNGNHTPAIEDIISGLGFRSATSLGMRLWHRDRHRFALPRIAIGRYDDLDRFKLRLAGI